MNGARDKTLRDYAEVLAWVESRGLEAAVIGGLAVGFYAPNVGATALSVDLDLLMTEEHRGLFARSLAGVEGARVVKAPQPRSVPVMVVDWKGLEVDILTRSTGLPEPQRALARAWRVGDAHVADPVDLLANKLAVRREKDEEHIAILQPVCRMLALVEFTTRQGRGAIDLLQRWIAVEGWRSMPSNVFSEFEACAAETSAQGRRLLVRFAGTAQEAERVVERAPTSERVGLRAMRSRR